MSTQLAFDIFARDRASKTFDKVGDSADGAGSKFAKMGKVAKFGALGLAAGAVIAGKALFDMTKSAIADEAAQAKLAKQLKSSAGATRAQVGATEDWITAQGKALGVTDDQLRPALAKLVVATKDVDKAQRLASLAMNISAGTGKDLGAVSTALAKAQNGNVAGLSRLGIATKDASGHTKSLEQITRELADTYKGAASSAANTTEGKFARLKLQMDETKEAIGAKLIPVASDLADFMLTKMGPALGKAGAWAKENLLPPLRQDGEFIQTKVIPAAKELGEKVLNGLRGFIDKVSASLKENKPFIEQVGKALAKVAEFIYTKVYPALGSIAEKALPLLGASIGASITVLKKLTTAFLFLGEYGVKAFAFLLDAALATFGGILKAASVGLGWIPGIGGKIKDAEVAFSKFRENTINDLNKVADTLHGVRDAINGIPGNKTVKVNVVTTSTGVKIPTSGTVPGKNNVKRAIASAPDAPGELGGFEAADAPAPRSPGGRTGAGILGTVEVIVKSDTGEVIERKLAKVKRRDGGRKLAFES